MNKNCENCIHCFVDKENDLMCNVNPRLIDGREHYEACSSMRGEHMTETCGPTAKWFEPSPIKANLPRVSDWAGN